MRVNFSVTNQLATPSIHAAALANRPPAGQPGRLFVDTDNPSTGIYRDTGTVWENITGGASAGNLQTVTDAGNTTDNNILLTYADNTIANALVFYNDALTQEEYIIEKRGTGITTNDSLAIQSRGNISPSTNPVGFLIDGANDVIKSFYTTSYTENGLKLDFVNENYYLGNLTNHFLQIDGSSGDTILQCTNSWNLIADINCVLTADPQVIKSTYFGTDTGLKLDFANLEYYLGGVSDQYNVKVSQTTGVDIGDIFGAANGNQINLTNDIIKTQHSSNDTGLYLDFLNQSYDLGNPASTLFRVNDGNGRLQSKYNGDDIGISFDLQNGEYYIGDFDGISNGVFLLVDNTDQLVKTATINGDIGLKLDFANSIYELGNNSSTYLKVDDANTVIETFSLNVGPGGAGGLRLDFATNSYSLGDYNSGVTGTYIIVDDANQLIKTSWQAADIGLKLDYVNSVYYLGDFNNIQDLIYCKADIGNGYFDIASAQYVNFRAEGANVQIGDIDNFDNGTRFGVDDLNQKLTATTNLLVGSSGSSSGQHLKIKVGTTDYVIELKNP